MSLLDVAPTILDYLGIPVPAYMEGQSLLRDTSERPLIGIRREGNQRSLTVIDCHRWFDSREDGLTMGFVSNHSAACRRAPMVNEIDSRLRRYFAPSPPPLSTELRRAFHRFPRTDRG